MTTQNRNPALETILNEQFQEIKDKLRQSGSSLMAQKIVDETFGKSLGLKADWFFESETAEEFFDTLFEERQKRSNPFHDLFGSFSVREEPFAGCTGCGVAGDPEPTNDDKIEEILGQILGKDFKFVHNLGAPSVEETPSFLSNDTISTLMAAIPEGNEESFASLKIEIGGKGATLLGKFIEEQVRKYLELFREVDENLHASIRFKQERAIL